MTTTPVDLLLRFLSTYQEGTVVLPHGPAAWKVATKSAPTQVWVSEVACGNIPVCHGSVNTYGVSLLPDGFVLIADVKSETAQVAFQATLAG